MNSTRATGWVVVALLGLLAVMAALMSRPLREESATVDEPLFLVSGYSYWMGYGYGLNPEQPPLSQKLCALPLLARDVRLSADAVAGLERRSGYDTARPWAGPSRPVAELFPDGRRDWYFWPYAEGISLGQMFVYGGDNDADRLLAAGRWAAVILTLLTGLVIFLWTRHLAGQMAALLGVVLWVFNPLALGYGHLIITDVGAALMMPLAVWTGIEFIQSPTWRRAALCGAVSGAAVCMKFTALVLGPIFLVLAVVRWLTCPPKERRLRVMLQWLPVAVLTSIAVVWLVYAPSWSPAPALTADRAAQLGVPWWFQEFRPVLIPPEFFKGITLQFAHARAGHEAFLCGEWRQHGWWYYFPLAILWKTPIPLLLLGLLAAVAWLRHYRQTRFAVAAPWLAALIYVGFAMAGGIDVGVRYLLPCVPLVTVGACAVVAGRSAVWRVGAWALGVWLAVIAFTTRPYYVEYFNGLAGGTGQGYHYLADSNYDWGQDLKRLRDYLRDHPREHIQLVYFGPHRAIEYYRLPVEIATDRVPTATSGTLVISATQLVKPEWSWLRTGFTPVARVGCTLFVYDLDRH